MTEETRIQRVVASGRDDGDRLHIRHKGDLDARAQGDTRLWAALQDVSGGSWGGAVFDTDTILELLAAGKKALGR